MILQVAKRIANIGFGQSWESLLRNNKQQEDI